MSEKCPICGAAAYISFLSHKIECAGEKCQNYAPDLYPKETVTTVEQNVASEEEPDKVLYYWSTYHTDCGD